MIVRQDILEFSDRHPIDVEVMCRLVDFPTKAAAAVQAHTWVKQKKWRCIGYVHEGIGRPRAVYFSGPRAPKPDILLHEVKMTMALTPFLGLAAFNRGTDVNRTTRPDAEMYLGDECYEWELDHGTLPKSKVQQRWEKYKNFNPLDVLLVVLANNKKTGLNSQDRMWDMLRWSVSIINIAWFVTLEDLLADPWGDVWTVLGSDEKQRIERPK